MTKFYSKSTGGFYDETIHGIREIEEFETDPKNGDVLKVNKRSNPDTKIPSDAVEISDSEYADLLTAQAKGASISFDAELGNPVATARAALTESELLELGFNDIRLALQKEIDLKARALGFSGGNALMLYAGFDNQFQPLAEAFAKWEANVWAAAEAYKVTVISGNAAMLTSDEAVAMMDPLILD